LSRWICRTHTVGFYGLFTNQELRGKAALGLYRGVGDIIAHPVNTAVGIFSRTSNYLSNTSIGEIGQDSLRFSAVALASAGSGKIVSKVGGAAVDLTEGAISGSRGAASVVAEQTAVSSVTEQAALRRAYLNDKFGRTGDINLDINIRGNQEAATNFFRSQGVPEANISSYLTGIDFTQPVSVQTIGSGKSLWQYQTPGAPQGNWYSFSPSVQPTELGISPFGFNRATQTVEPKILNSYLTTESVNMLRSTSASVNDFWSVSGQSYPTVGGARQLFSTQKPAFVLTPK
jgi:hypothetical protein